MARRQPNIDCDSDVCRICGDRLTPLFSAAQVPVHIGIQWSDQGSARTCPKGDLELARCSECGFVANTAFDAAKMEYDGVYENSLHFSPLFTRYATNLADHLASRYNLRGGKIIEVGCGHGEFLSMLCERGDADGLGFDPSLDPVTLPPDTTGRMTFHARPFGEGDENLSPDMVCCRQVLEHIPSPIDFLQMIDGTVADSNPVYFFEVPDTTRAIEAVSVWDFIYEHCSNFGATSLARAFTEAGLTPMDVRPLFEGIFVGVEAQRTPPESGQAFSGTASAADNDAADRFVREAPSRISYWEHTLADLAAKGKRAVLWGAGARGVMFLNLIPTATTIEYAVDLNPRKHGLHLAGGGQEIVPPDRLIEVQPDVVIMTNGIYENEVRTALTTLGLSPRILVA